MPDTDHEYLGVSIVVNSSALPNGSWSAVYTLHEENPRVTAPFTIDPITGSSRAEVERKALAEAHNEIDKTRLLRAVLERERQVRG